VNNTLFFTHAHIYTYSLTQEGEAFLEGQGMKITDDDVKTRAQKEKLEEITNDATDKPKLPREGTMAVTAKVCGSGCVGVWVCGCVGMDV